MTQSVPQFTPLTFILILKIHESETEKKTGRVCNLQVYMTKKFTDILFVS